MAIFSGQGEVFTATRDASGNPQEFAWVGNAPNFELNLGVETLTHKESYSGNRQTDYRIITENNANLSITLQDIKEANFNLMLYGTAAAIAGSSVVGESVLTTIPVVGEAYALKATGRVSAVTVKGNAIAVATSKYTVDGSGSLRFTDVSGVAAPITVDYTQAASREIGMFKTGAPERYLRFFGKNTAERTGTGDFKRVTLDVFKTTFDPAETMSFIGDGFNEFVLKGSALIDALRSSASQSGQFARLIYVD